MLAGGCDNAPKQDMVSRKQNGYIAISGRWSIVVAISRAHFRLLGHSLVVVAEYA